MNDIRARLRVELKESDLLDVDDKGQLPALRGQPTLQRTQSTDRAVTATEGVARQLKQVREAEPETKQK